MHNKAIDVLRQDNEKREFSKHFELSKEELGMKKGGNYLFMQHSFVDFLCYALCEKLNRRLIHDDGIKEAFPSYMLMIS